MLRQELRAYGPKDPARGIKSREGLPSDRLWAFPSRAPIQISRVRTHAKATDTAREGANHGRRPELSVPICPPIGTADRAARRAIELDERRTARRLGSDSGARFPG